jgi:MFS superfamily sulfate permease-like transporter
MDLNKRSMPVFIASLLKGKAVFIGIIMSALVFSWENALRIRARKRIKQDGTKVYEIWGPLFFGSTQMFMSKFDVKGDPVNVEIDDPRYYVVADPNSFHESPTKA